MEAEEADNLIGLDEAAENDPLKHYMLSCRIRFAGCKKIKRESKDKKPTLEVRKGNSKFLQRCAWWHPEKFVMDTPKCVGDSQRDTRELLKPNFKHWKVRGIVSPKFWVFRAGTCYLCFFPCRGVSASPNSSMEIAYLLINLVQCDLHHTL